MNFFYPIFHKYFDVWKKNNIIIISTHYFLNSILFSISCCFILVPFVFRRIYRFPYILTTWIPYSSRPNRVQTGTQLVYSGEGYIHPGAPGNLTMRQSSSAMVVWPRLRRGHYMQSERGKYGRLTIARYIKKS